MLVAFFILSILDSAAIGCAAGWFRSWNALWQIPLVLLGSYVAWILLFALVLVVASRFVDTKKLLQKPSSFFRFMTAEMSRLIFFHGGVQVHVSGLERIPDDRRYMLVSNHLYALDPLVFYYAVPAENRLSFISKKENFSMFLVPQIMHALMCLPIDRENDRSALKTILTAIQFLKEGRTSIAVFPEGGTSKTGELKPFRNGVFKIAQRSATPIVVSVLINTQALRKNLFRRRTDVYLDILTVIPPEQFAGLSTVQIGDLVHGIMEEGIAQHRAELEQIQS